MALRDQPYIPLYVQDFLTDEKLNECSAMATGVYIKIMCVLHKSDPYGKFLLKQKYKQTDQQILNFANSLVKHLSFDTTTIQSALKELLAEGCLKIDGDYLIQKRMVSDGEISIKRSYAGKKGAASEKKFAIPKGSAKSENEIANAIENVNGIVKGNGFWEKEEAKVYPIEKCLTISMNDDRWVRANSTGQPELERFNQILEQMGVYEKNPADYKKHFSNLKKKFPESVKPQAKVYSIDELREMAKTATW